MSADGPSAGRDAPRLAAYVLILAGAAWLLAATGFIPDRFVRAGAVLWPLVAVGLGLDVWGIRRPPAGIPYSLIALAAITIVGLFFGPAPERVVDPARGFVEPLESANRAEIVIDSDMTSLLVRGGAPEGVLAEGTPFGAARLEIDAAGRAVRRLAVGADGPDGGRGGAAGTVAADAEVRLTDRIPLELEVRGGGRATTLDLSGLSLASVGFAGAAGPSSITLGGVGPERFDATIAGGRGPLDVTIPAGTRLNLRLEPGQGGAAVSVGEQTDATIVLRGGDGPVALALPEEARVRVVVEDATGGIVTVPDRLRKVASVAEGEDADIYQTPGFREVVPVLDIRVEEAGEGPIAIR